MERDAHKNCKASTCNDEDEMDSRRRRIYGRGECADVLVRGCARMCEDVGVLIVQDDRHWPRFVDESARNLSLPY